MGTLFEYLGLDKDAGTIPVGRIVLVCSTDVLFGSSKETWSAVSVPPGIPKTASFPVTETTFSSNGVRESSSLGPPPVLLWHKFIMSYLEANLNDVILSLT